jgi:hypothetical protein
MFSKAMVFAVTCGALTFGCGADPAADSAAETQEITENLIAAGRDAVVSLESSREMLQVDDRAGGEEQYRTNNLVSRSLANICVNGAAFTGSFSTALNGAIANYNNQGLTFHMTRTSGSTAGCNAVITARITTGTGGVSGFPSGGVPFNAINIGSGLNGFAVNTIKHVITHELGHTIGFRHSDFFNRTISCGTGGNEGDGGVGAILIAGTPSGATVGGSIMNSCFRTTETGNFTGSDVTALQNLY